MPKLTRIDLAALALMRAIPSNLACAKIMLYGCFGGLPAYTVFHFLIN